MYPPYLGHLWSDFNERGVIRLGRCRGFTPGNQQSHGRHTGSPKPLRRTEDVGETTLLPVDRNSRDNGSFSTRGGPH